MRHNQLDVLVVCVCVGGQLNSKLCFIKFSKSFKWTKENMAGSQWGLSRAGCPAQKPSLLCHFLLELNLIPENHVTPWSGVRKEEHESWGWIRTNSQYSSPQANGRPETPDTSPPVHSHQPGVFLQTSLRGGDNSYPSEAPSFLLECLTSPSDYQFTHCALLKPCPRVESPETPPPCVISGALILSNCNSCFLPVAIFIRT